MNDPVIYGFSYEPPFLPVRRWTPMLSHWAMLTQLEKDYFKPVSHLTGLLVYKIYCKRERNVII